eukprot:12756251-Alexandrium_andersonii.AAC.1
MHASELLDCDPPEPWVGSLLSSELFGPEFLVGTSGGIGVCDVVCPRPALDPEYGNEFAAKRRHLRVLT